MNGGNADIENDAFRLTIAASESGVLHATLEDRVSELVCADAPYLYRATRVAGQDSVVSHGLRDVTMQVEGDTARITGTLAGLSVAHRLCLPADRPVLEERLVFRNDTDRTIDIESVRTGFRLPLYGGGGSKVPACMEDRFVAVPMRHDGMSTNDETLDMSLAEMMVRRGDERRLGRWQVGCIPELHWVSEAWAWIHGEHALLIAKFNQDAMEYSVARVGMDPPEGRCVLTFGGSDTTGGDPWRLLGIQPGESRAFGTTRYVTVEGGHKDACRAYRDYLDTQGCRFPAGWNPPVHWNELFDNPEWGLWTPGREPQETWTERPPETRKVTYTREMMEEEAIKAVAYGCETLYLDPGWDTAFGSFIWGEEWLGPCDRFVEEMRERHGLKVAVHLATAPWMSDTGSRATDEWPRDGRRMDADGTLMDKICMGSRQYLDEATARLLKLCEAGVAYFMFDGNHFMTCHNPDHGHPVPFTIEDHINANIELTRRIHYAYPDVIVEMHNMVYGRQDMRPAPLYYKYGLPGSYDETWGWELMGRPFASLRDGRALTMYDHAIGCNVPVYCHIDLTDDTVGCVGLWWFASTCRHLGIGGTHPDPAVAEAQKQAMNKYRRLKRFFVEGEFRGMSEEVHAHVLPGCGDVVFNVFNLSGEYRTVRSKIGIHSLGLGSDRWYSSGPSVHFMPASREVLVKRYLPPWSAEVLEMKSYEVPSTFRTEGAKEEGR